MVLQAIKLVGAHGLPAAVKHDNAGCLSCSGKLFIGSETILRIMGQFYAE
jgi:hypothetical protein